MLEAVGLANHRHHNHHWTSLSTSTPPISRWNTTIPTQSNWSNTPTQSNWSNSPTQSHWSNTPSPPNWSNTPTQSHWSNTPSPPNWSNSPASSNNHHHIRRDAEEASIMPGYTPLHWGESTRWRKKVSMDSSEMLWHDNIANCAPWTTDPTADFPWDKQSIMDDRNIPWQSQQQQYQATVYDCAPLGTSISRINDLSVTLDPSNLVQQSLASKYQPLRESPTPPKSKKKCINNRNNIEETVLHQKTVAAHSHSVQDMNEINLRVDSVNQALSTNLSNQSQSGVYGLAHSPNSAGPSTPTCGDFTPASSSVQSGNATSSAPFSNAPCIDRAAFERYYEGSLLGDNCPPSLPTRSNNTRPPVEDQGVCGGLGPLSLALALPGKLEGLLKLLAQSLHLVLAGFCSRKARRNKDRESPAAEQEHKLYLEEAVLERKIPETDLRQLVELPPGLGYHEWLASHTIDFFQHINLVYGTIAEFCTMSGCSDMSGPATRPYLWFDEKGKKVRVAAPQYIDYVMTFTQKTINDETIFPTKFENDFPVSFESIVKKIHRLLFHVIAHLYHSHFRELVLLSLHAHLNCIFAHFTLFNERFRLIEEKETEILHDLVLALRLHPSENREKAAAAQAAAGDDCGDSIRTPGEDEESTSCSGRASPTAGATPGSTTACEPHHPIVTGLDDPLSNAPAASTPTAGTPTVVEAPFISPDVTDIRP